jgi:hypothetical protein
VVDRRAQRNQSRVIDLSGAVVPGTNLSHANLTKANLRNANLSGANLTMAVLVEAQLQKAKLRGASLFHADLSGANMSSADLSGANLKGARFANAIMRLATLHGADLREADLSEAKELGWLQVIDGLVNESTKLPAYLSEAELFEALAIIYPGTKWAVQYGGRSKDLLGELCALAEKAEKSSIQDVLRQIRVYENRREDQPINVGLREPD